MMAGAKKNQDKQQNPAAQAEKNTSNSKSMKSDDFDKEEGLEEEDEEEDFEDEEEDEDDEDELDEDDDEKVTGTPDTDYNLISVLYHALQGAETYAEYVDDAADAGDKELEEFFAAVQREESSRADRAKQLLSARLMRARTGQGRMDRPGASKPAPM